MKEHSSKFGWLLPALMAAVSPTGWSQQSDTSQQRGPWVWGISGGAIQQFEADSKDGDGDFSVSRGFVQPSISYAWDRRNSVSLSFGAGISNYDFSSDALIGRAEPWDDILDYRVSLPVRFSPTERSDVILIPSVRSYGEDGTSLSDGRTEGVLAAAGWKFSETLTLGPGFGWFSEVGGGSNLFPVILIDWKITENMSLTTGRGLAASQGPGLTLNYDMSEKWNLGVSGRYEKTRFALDDREGYSDRVGEDESLPLTLSFTYTPWPMTSISGLVGTEFASTLRQEDSRGNVTAKSDFDTALVFGLAFSSRF